MTSPLHLAKRYLEIFCSGEDLDRLYPLLADDLRFQGPFHEYASARAYVEALKADPPRGVRCTILGAYEQSGSACLVYRFTKPGVDTLMAQQFEVERERIGKMVLIFNTAAFG